MRKLVWVVVCSVGMGPVAMSAQSDRSTEKALRDSLVKNSFILRNFSDDAVVHAEWNGTELTLYAPQWRTMGVIAIRSVKLKGQQVRIDGIRQTLLQDGTGKLAPYGPEQVEIVVDLHGADPNSVLPELKDELFFPTVDAAVAAVPRYLQRTVPGHVVAGSPPRQPPAPACSCADQSAEACMGQHLNGMTAPRLLHGESPHMTDEARRAKVKGTVQVAVTVDRTGQPTDLWIVRPLGFGLDAAAAQSVQNYAFEPATCDGKGVPVALYIDVNFQVY